MVKLRAKGIAFAIQPAVHIVGKFLEYIPLTSAKEEIGSPVSTRLMSVKSRQTAVMTTMATNVDGRSFFKTGIPTFPKIMGKPKQIAVVHTMTMKFSNNPPS
jgi:hypothetical protein